MNNNISSYLLCIFILCSCGQNSYEKDLNGKWYSLTNDGYTRMSFYPDSLIFTEIYSQNTQWTANDSIFEFDFRFKHPYLINKTEKLITSYRLSKEKDTLYCKLRDSIGLRNCKFIRADNYIEYLSKKNGLLLDLPIDLQVGHVQLDSEYGFKIFIEENKSGLTGFTEFGHTLDSLYSDLIVFNKKFKQSDQFHLDKLKRESHFRIFADKSISDEKIATYFQKRNSSRIDKTYRMYESEEYENLGYLRGKNINAIFNKVHN